MSFVKSLSLAAAAIIVSGGAVLAQAGGADVPTDAKKQGTKENGSSSTGMSQGEAHSGSGSSGSMQKEGGSMEKKSGDKM